MFQTFALKVCPLIFVAVLGACGGGEDDTQPVTENDSQQQVNIPERSICMTTVPTPPECIKK